jgi:glyoxylase-like metal-dependent hydrolase (beta-lactamase superfamily II)
MDLVQLTDMAYQLRGGSNAGLILNGDQAVLIDTGLDKDTAKKILRHVETLKVKVSAVVITHAHADHFGGAATIRARTGARIYAPQLEAAIVENPILEPLYLFSGAMPPAELRHKFTLAEACKVDEHVAPGRLSLSGIAVALIAAPGHAPNQVMVAGGGACFVADAVFAPDVLAKHGIPFMVDVDAWLKTLGGFEALTATQSSSYAAFVPGHGPAVADILPWARQNTERLEEIRRNVAEAVKETDELGRLIQICANRLGLTIPNLTTYLLTQTAILACLASLQAQGELQMNVQENRLILQ